MLYKFMSEMLDGLLNEDSTAMNAIRKSPYSDQLVRVIHKEMAMPHNVDWWKVDKVSWKDIKERAPNYVLIGGTEGCAAIRWGGGQYEVYVSYNEGITKHNSESSTAIMTYVRAGIGKITGYFEATNQGQRDRWQRSYARGGIGDVENLRRQRQTAKRISGATIFDPSANTDQNFSTLINKLKPIYVRAIDAAIADLKGAAAISLKNDAYDRAMAKLEHVKSLATMRDEISDPDSTEKRIPEFIQKSMRHAIYMTAGYFYPEKTGEITRGSRYQNAKSDQGEGAKQVIIDIANGDQKKLSTIMSFFKQDLLHQQ